MPSKKDAKKFMRSMSERAALALEKKLAGVDPRSPWARYFPNDFLEDENKVDDPRILANAETLDSLGRGGHRRVSAHARRLVSLDISGWTPPPRAVRGEGASPPK